MNKLALIIGCIFILGLFVSTVYFSDTTIEDTSDLKESIFHGPVPEGYDLEYFKKTGITKKMKENN